MLIVKRHDIRCEPKSYKFKLLEKLVVQHNIRASFDGRSCVRASPHIYFPNLLRKPKETNHGCLPMGLCISPHACMRQHVWEGFKEHDINCETKSYKLKLFLCIWRVGIGNIRIVGPFSLRVLSLNFLYICMLTLIKKKIYMYAYQWQHYHRCCPTILDATVQYNMFCSRKHLIIKALVCAKECLFEGMNLAVSGGTIYKSNIKILA